MHLITTSWSIVHAIMTSGQGSFENVSPTLYEQHGCANSTVQCWWDNQKNREKAYVLMAEALIRAGLKLTSREALNYSPAVKTSNS